MSRKENVKIVRPDDFESIDEELAQAMVLLDETNSRVLDLLTSETVDDQAALPMETTEEAEPAPGRSEDEGEPLAAEEVGTGD